MAKRKRSINIQQMLHRIHQLVESDKEKENQKHQMQFNLLQAQINPHFMYNTLFSIKCVVDMDSSYIDYLIEKGCGGIVIEALGRGNVPPKMVEGIKKAIELDIPVVVVSRCFEGRVFESYGYEGGGKQLKDLGVIFGDTLLGQKARIKLILAINSGMNIHEVARAF